jgi:hypothetical protein
MGRSLIRHQKPLSRSNSIEVFKFYLSNSKIQIFKCFFLVIKIVLNNIAPYNIYGSSI